MASLAKSRVILSKIQRAKKHIEELISALEAFWDSEPNSVRFEDEPTTGRRTYYLDRVTDVPLEIPVIIGDVLHNLRSALDHLAYQLPVIPSQTGPRWTQFPIVESAAKYMASDVRRKVQVFRPDVVKTLDVVKPYKGGNELLWRLHSLNTIDKHRLLLTACITNTARTMTPTEREELDKMFRGSYPGETTPDLTRTLKAVATVPLIAGAKLHTVSQSELEPYIQFHFDVAFNEPDIIECQSVVETLHEMAKLVGKIVLDFDPLLA
jgi:hypothetical protein